MVRWAQTLQAAAQRQAVLKGFSRPKAFLLFDPGGLPLSAATH
jgi:hypothetical protein